jgi:hemoglobin/transferrin/lactoferrin receptor protein
MQNDFIVKVIGKYGIRAMGDYSGRLRYGVALGALVLAMASPAVAQQRPAQSATSEQPVALDAIVVQGEAAVAAPLLQGPTTTTTTRAELDRQQIQSITDLSNRVEAGISFNRANGSVNIRGLDGARVLTTVDGIRQTFVTDNRLDKGTTTAFDFDALSTLDLLRGNSGGATLGGGALGGALAVRTLDPKDLIKPGQNFGVLAKTGYDSTDRAWFGSSAVAGRYQNTYVLLQGSFRDGHETNNNGDIKTIGVTRTAPNPTDFTQVGFLGKVHHYVDDVHRFGITGEYFRREDRVKLLTGTGVSLTGNIRPWNNNTGEDVERKRVSLTYDYKLPGGFLDEASANLYWQNTTRNGLIRTYRYTSVVGPYARDNEIDEEAFGFNGHVLKRFQTGALTHGVTLGTELRMSTMDQYSKGFDRCRLPYTGAFSACNNLHTNQADTPKVDGRMAGFYLHDEIGMLDNRLRVTPGVRFDWYEEKPQYTASYFSGGSRPTTLPNSSSDSAWSPRIRFEYDVLKNTPWFKDVTVFAQWSKGFRAPTVGELYARFGAVGTYLRTGNPDLRPETSNGIDVGLKFGDKAFGGSLTYFHTNYRNFIEVVQTVPQGASALYPFGVTSYRNIARAEIQGFEANGQYAFAPNWLVRGSFSYIRGVNKDADTFLNSIPPMQGIVAVAYGTDVWGAEVSTKLAGPRDDVERGANAGFKAPGYAVFNASAWWRPTTLYDIELQVGVYNIFDRTYFDAISIPTGALVQARDYYAEPGRTVKATLKYQF